MPQQRTLSKQQIGRAGELLVQFRLLCRGIESAPMTTDTGIDLVAYSAKQGRAFTIQVKTNEQAKPGGGKGKLALDWWVPIGSPAEYQALVDLQTVRVWLLRTDELPELAQQTTSERHHIYMYIDPTHTPRKTGRLVHDHQFQSYLLENVADGIFEA